MSKSFYITGGTLPVSADSYVARQADADLLEGLQQDEFCYVLNTRQMGKSSLMIRAAQSLRDAGRQVIVLDLTAVGKNLSVEQWYGGLVVRLAQQTEDRDALLDFWRNHPHLGPMQRLIEALRQVLLTPEEGARRKLVIFLDEIDMVRSLPFSVDEFFASIRECYNRRPSDPIFQNLSFCLLGVATPSDLIHDTRISPFNIGRRIELRDFTPEEAEPLALGLLPDASEGAGSQSDALYARLNPRGLRMLKRILHWTNGHPYMTQRLCRAVAESLADAGMQSDDDLEDMAVVDRECERFFLSKSARETDDNLAFVRNRLLSSGEDTTAVLELYGQVRAGKRVRDDETNPLCSILRLSGIVAVERGFLRLRNRVYHQIFDSAWVLSHMPDAELRRQKRAYRQGIQRTTAIATAVLMVVSALAFHAIVSEKRARKAAGTANAAAKTAHNAEAYANSLLYARQMQEVQSAYNAHDLMRACDLLEKTRTYPGRGFEWDYWYRLAHQERFTLPVPGPRSMVVYSRDGKWVVTQTQSNDTIPHIDLWDAQNGHAIRTIPGRTIPLHGVDSPVAADLIAIVRAPDGHAGPALLIDPRTGETLHTLGSEATQATLSGDGKRVFTLENHDGAHNTLKIWDAQRGTLMFPPRLLQGPQTFGELVDEGTIQSTVDSRLLAFGGGHHRFPCPLTLLETTTNKPRWAPPGKVSFYALSPQARYIAVHEPPNPDFYAGDLIGIRVWDLQTHRRIVLGESGRQYTALNLQFSRDERLLVGAGGQEGHQGQVWIWDVKTGRERRMLLDQNEIVYGSLFSPDGKSLFTVSSDNTARQWNLENGKKGDVYFWNGVGLPALSAHNDCIVVGDGSAVRAYPLAAPPVQALQILPHSDYLHFLSDNRHVVYCTIRGPMNARGTSDAGTYGLNCYDIETGSTTTYPQQSPLQDTEFTDKGSKALNTLQNVSTVSCEIRDVRTNRLLGTLPGTKASDDAEFSREGTLIYTLGDNIIRVWDAQTYREIAHLPPPPYIIKKITFVQQGRKMVCKGDDNKAHVRDGQTGRELYTFDLGPASQTIEDAQITESPDSSVLCAMITDGFQVAKVAVYDMETGQLRFTRANALPCMSPQALSRDSRYMAWGDMQQNVHVVELATGKEIQMLHSVGGFCTGIGWSPDGRRLLTSTLGGSCKLWDLQSAAALMTFPKPRGRVWGIDFSPDGKSVWAVIRLEPTEWANCIWTLRAP